MLYLDCPFFHPPYLATLKSTPKGSAAWNDAIEGVRSDIFSCEGFLCTLGLSNFDWKGDFGRFSLDRSRGHCELWFECDSTNRRLIECPIDIRLQGYSNLPRLYDHLIQLSQSEASSDDDGAQRSSVGARIKAALGSVQNLLPTGAEARALAENLERLQKEQPNLKSSPGAYLEWIKRLVATLLSFDGFKTLFQSLLKNSPELWASLSLRNKLLVGGLIPAIGGGLALGGIGLAGGGTAVGVPSVAVVILILAMLGGVSGLLEDLILLLRVRSSMNRADADTLKSVGEELGAIIQKMILDAFLRSQPKTTTNSKNYSSTEEEFEHVAANYIAKKYRGIPSVTQRSGDFGVDGIVVCNDTKEVILVQAKCYKNRVGFPDVTQSAGSLLYWQRRFANSFEHPISRIVLVSRSGFSIEAQKAAELLPVVELEHIPDFASP